MRTLRIGCVAVALLAPAFKSRGANLPSQVEGHRSGLAALVTAADGASRTVRLAGVGCTESMCSRVFIRTRSENGAPLQTWLDSVASIKDTTERDAIFVMKDGTTRRMGFTADFRVLYVSSRNGGPQKLDLANIRTLEFLDPGK